MKRLQTKNQEAKIAVVTDIHGDVQATKILASKIKKEQVDIIILAGDIPQYTKKNLRDCIRPFLKLKLPLVVFPGSHENTLQFNEALEIFQQKKNLINAIYKKNRGIHLGIYDLFFIPGSDSLIYNPYPYKSADVLIVEKKKTTRRKKECIEWLTEDKRSKKPTLVFLEDVKNFIKKNKEVPAKRCMVFSHIPIRCTTTKGIDLARSGYTTEPFIIKAKHGRLKKFQNVGYETGDIIFEGRIIPSQQTTMLKEYGYPIKARKKNVGSIGIKKILNSFRITKFICGHIHEAGPRAINKEECKVRKNKWSKECFINNGTGFDEHGTIIYLNKKGELKYKFI